jgi:hypothetical protein
MRRGYRLAFCVIGCVLLTALGSPAAAAPRFTFAIHYGDYCLSGRAPASESLTVSLSSPTRTLLAQDTTTAAVDGSFTACFFSALSGGPQARYILAGKQLTVDDGTASRALVVPPLTMSFDYAGNAVRGLAPANQTVMVGLRNCFSTAGCTTSPFALARSVQADTTRHWVAKFGAQQWILRGQQRAEATLKLATGDTITNDRFTPSITAFVGGSEAYGYGPAPFGTVDLKLYGPTKALLADGTGTGDWDGSFTVDFLHNATPVNFGVGREIIGFEKTFLGAETAQLTVRLNVISGRCAGENLPFRIEATYNGYQSRLHYGVTNGTGHFSTTLLDGAGHTWVPQPADQFTLDCLGTRGEVAEFIARAFFP